MPKKKKEPRLTASRYVSKQYGEKGLRALKAMGTPFVRQLQREIVDRRDLQVLVAKKDALEKALDALGAKIMKAKEALPEDPCLPRLEAVIDTLPDLKPKKAEPPAEEPETEEAPEAAEVA